MGDEVPSVSDPKYWSPRPVGDTPAVVYVANPPTTPVPPFTQVNADHKYPTNYPKPLPPSAPKAPPPIKKVNTIPPERQQFGNTYTDFSRPGNSMAKNPGLGLMTQKYRSLHVNYDGITQS